MNTTTHSEANALQTVNQSAVAESSRVQASSLMLDIATMESLMRVAELMASGKSTVPAHLQKNPADCMAVCMQSMQWGMNPFAVAQKTHLVNGTLGYEAQLVNAVVQASGAIDGRFSYEYKGTSPNLECRVGAVISGDKEITWGNWLNESKVTTKNSPLWKTNPSQQLGYLQLKNWARLFTPGAILGVYTQDELEERAPRNMGYAQMEAAPAAAPGVLEAAQSAAEEGVAVYADFWKKASPETRKAIGKPEHDRLKLVAEAADKARTVDNTAAPGKTFAEVMTMITTATSIDQLYVAGDWVSAIDNLEEQNILAAKFDEMKAELAAS